MLSALFEMLLVDGVAAQASNARLCDQAPPIVTSKPMSAAAIRTAAVANDSRTTIHALRRGVTFRNCSARPGSGDIAARWPRGEPLLIQRREQIIRPCGLFVVEDCF